MRGSNHGSRRARTGASRWLWAALVLAGCLPDAPENRLLCEESADCPPGWVCRRPEPGLGRCVSREDSRDPASEPDASAPEADGAAVDPCRDGASCADAAEVLPEADAMAPTDAGTSPTPSDAASDARTPGPCDAATRACAPSETKQVTRPCGTCAKGVESGTAVCSASCTWQEPTRWSGCTSRDACTPGETTACNVGDCMNGSKGASNCPKCGVRRCRADSCTFGPCESRVPKSQNGCLEDHWDCCGEDKWVWCNPDTCMFPLANCAPCPSGSCSCDG